jgi:hypothetical protein
VIFFVCVCVNERHSFFFEWKILFHFEFFIVFKK